MKKLVKIFIILMILAITPTVYAENYGVRKLIPINTKVTVYTDNFMYDEISCDQNVINFGRIKNLRDIDMPISISVGLFDETDTNIGNVNYCEDLIEAKKSLSYSIRIKDAYLGEGKSNSQIKYITVLSDNSICHTTGNRVDVGRNIEELGVTYKEKYMIDKKTAVVIFAIVAIIFLFGILYKSVFNKLSIDISSNKVKKESIIKKKKDDIEVLTDEEFKSDKFNYTDSILDDSEDNKDNQ